MLAEPDIHRRAIRIGAPLVRPREPGFCRGALKDWRIAHNVAAKWYRAFAFGHAIPAR